jgi:hypothetical protein
MNYQADHHHRDVDRRGQTMFAFLSPILGWLGTAVTGSELGERLFSPCSRPLASRASIDPHLLVAAKASEACSADDHTAESLDRCHSGRLAEVEGVIFTASSAPAWAARCSASGLPPVHPVLSGYCDHQPRSTDRRCARALTAGSEARLRRLVRLHAPQPRRAVAVLRAARCRAAIQVPDLVGSAPQTLATEWPGPAAPGPPRHR